jgi:NTE family protein
LFPNLPIEPEAGVWLNVFDRLVAPFLRIMTADTQKQMPSVSLVLGSGGARGLAHIGIIQWLQENNYRIQSVAGSSIGAVVGGIFAAGKLPVYTEWVTALSKADVLLLLDFSFSRAGLFKGERIIELLKEVIGEYNIEDLPISFTAVATDVVAGKEVWMDRGSLFDAIRASFAIPTLFTPHEYCGRRLLDGGLVNPVPIAPTLKDLTDLTIAVNLNGHEMAITQNTENVQPTKGPEGHYKKLINKFIEELSHRKQDRDDKLGFFEIVQRSLETMQSTISRLKLAVYSPDVIIEIPKNACGPFEFYRAAEMIALGRHIAEQSFSAANLDGATFGHRRTTMLSP